MVIPPPTLSGTASAVRNQFLEPLRTVFAQATPQRKCSAESDWDWLTKGVDRVLANVRRGRDFLQTLQMFWAHALQVGPYFETLASVRRLTMVAECSALLRQLVDTLSPSPLAQFAAQATFDLYASDVQTLHPKLVVEVVTGWRGCPAFTCCPNAGWSNAPSAG